MLFVLAPAFAACVSACGGDDVLAPLDAGGDATMNDASADGDSSTSIDGAKDSPVGSDSPGTDTGSDTGADAGVDTGADAGVDTGVDTGIDAGVDTGMEAGLDGDADGGFLVVNGCNASDYVDETDPDGSGRVVNGPPGATPQQYVPHCMMIRAGQSVLFQQGNFAQHPLEPAGGNTPNPITFTNTGAMVTFAFPNTGVYGFECNFHPGLMHGAIEVIP